MSISSVKQAEITKLSANSQADILRSIPGITAEGGGGETATNLFVRGLPSGGQYVFNPLQYDGMTFYQASYSDLGNGQYASTFSANVDQGRPLKYLGSLMLVLGAIWHYLLNRRKVKPGSEAKSNLMETA